MFPVTNQRDSSKRWQDVWSRSHNSWDKSFLHVGEYGAGAPKVTPWNKKTLMTMRRSYGANQVNWSILKLVMTCGNGQGDVRVKNLEGIGKDRRTKNDVIWANSTSSQGHLDNLANFLFM